MFSGKEMLKIQTDRRTEKKRDRETDEKKDR